MIQELSPLQTSIWLGVLGLLFGSFFNVLIYRMPRNLSLFRPGSACPECKTPIHWYLNIPVLSWLILRGKCSSCKAPIPWRYPAVEALTGVLGFVAVWAVNYGQTQVAWPQTLVVYWLLLTAVPVFFIDFEHQLIPDSVSLGGIVVGVLLSLMPGASLTFGQSLAGAAICGGSLWILGFLASKAMGKESMGFGDVKLVAGFGALLGWQSTLIGIVLASFFGLAFTLPIKWLKKEGSEIPLPFGPYLYLGAVTSALWGSSLLSWYLELAGF